MAITFILIGVSLGVIILDQIVKWVIALSMQLEESIPIIKGFFHITYLENPGMSFGLFGEENQRWIFMVISPIALIAIGVYLFGFAKKEKFTMKLGLTFILGGGLSNMIDRIFYGKSFFDNPWTIFEESFWDELFHGYVVDMFDFCGIWNAIFNVADSFVCVGAALVILSLLLDLIFNKSEEKPKVFDTDAEKPNTGNKVEIDEQHQENEVDSK